MLTLDSSAIIPLLNRDDRDHERVVRALEGDPGPYIVPVGLLGEVTYMIVDRLRSPALDGFLVSLESGSLTLDCGEQDLPRIRELIRRYDDLDLGFADACVIACAERNGGHVLTLDLRDFGAVARGEGTLTLLPD